MFEGKKPGVSQILVQSHLPFYKNKDFIIGTATFIIIVLTSAALFIKNTQIPTKHENKWNTTEITFPQTPPAHIEDIYASWQLNDRMKQELWEIVQNSPLNPKTNKHMLMVSVMNEGMIKFATNMICSMKYAQIDPRNQVTIALDMESYNAIKNIGGQAIYLESNFTRSAVNVRKKVDFYKIVKVRPTVVHQLLLWDVEAILVDIDIIFLSNPLPYFKDNADFEVQCDSRIFYKIPSDVQPLKWEINLGFYKLHPTPTVMELFPKWLKRMYDVPNIQDQDALRKILKQYPHRWIDNETTLVETTELLGTNYSNLTFRYLDPMLFVNPGGVFQDGKEDWLAEAHRRNIKRPVMCHFFHIGLVNGKIKSMKKNDLWFVDDNFLCLKNPPGGVDWPVWKQ